MRRASVRCTAMQRTGIRSFGSPRECGELLIKATQQLFITIFLLRNPPPIPFHATPSFAGVNALGRSKKETSLSLSPLSPRPWQSSPLHRRTRSPVLEVFVVVVGAPPRPSVSRWRARDHVTVQFPPETSVNHVTGHSAAEPAASRERRGGDGRWRQGRRDRETERALSPLYLFPPPSILSLSLSGYSVFVSC